MGAHVAGFTGKVVHGRINTIIGLDAANIGNVNDPTTRLDATGETLLLRPIPLTRKKRSFKNEILDCFLFP